MHQQLGTHRLRDRGTYTAGTASAAPVVELGRQISYFAVPVFVTERLAAILKIYKRLIRKTKNLLNIIQKAAENAKLKTSELPLTQQFLANVLRYVRYMLSAVRLLSVCDVGAPYSGG